MWRSGGVRRPRRNRSGPGDNRAVVAGSAADRRPAGHERSSILSGSARSFRAPSSPAHTGGAAAHGSRRDRTRTSRRPGQAAPRTRSGNPGAAGTAIPPSRPAPPGSSARSLTGTRNRQSAGTCSLMLNCDWTRPDLPTLADDAIIRTVLRPAIPPDGGVWRRTGCSRNEIWGSPGRDGRRSLGRPRDRTFGRSYDLLTIRAGRTILTG